MVTATCASYRLKRLQTETDRTTEQNVGGCFEENTEKKGIVSVCNDVGLYFLYILYVYIYIVQRVGKTVPTASFVLYKNNRIVISTQLSEESFLCCVLLLYCCINVPFV